MENKEVREHEYKERVFTLQNLLDCYSAGLLRGMAEAYGTEEKTLSPISYFKKNFGIDIEIFQKQKNYKP